MKEETQTIDGIAYTVRQMPAMLAVSVFTRLSHVLGEPVVHLMIGKINLDDKPEKLAPIVGNAFSMLSEVAATQTIEDLLGGLRTDNLCGSGAGGEVGKSFDMHFAGRIFHLLKVAKFALDLNYRDFSSALPFQTGDKSDEREESPSENSKG